VFCSIALDIGLTAGVTGRKGMLILPMHLILSLVYTEACVCQFLYIRSYEISHCSLSEVFYWWSSKAYQTKKCQIYIYKNDAFAINVFLKKKKKRHTQKNKELKLEERRCNDLMTLTSRVRIPLWDGGGALLWSNFSVTQWLPSLPVIGLQIINIPLWHWHSAVSYFCV
jgi:hypothetical protein